MAARADKKKFLIWWAVFGPLGIHMKVMGEDQAFWWRAALFLVSHAASVYLALGSLDLSFDVLNTPMSYEVVNMPVHRTFMERMLDFISWGAPISWCIWLSDLRFMKEFKY